MMNVYSTTDIEGSLRKLHEAFTHVVLARGYTLIKPVFFKGAGILDLPTFHHASWIKVSEAQAARWREQGGILVAADTKPFPGTENDATVMVECPYGMERIEQYKANASECLVIPNPVTWTTHEQCIDLRFPGVDVLKAMWAVCGGKRMTNIDLAAAVDLPVTWAQYMKTSLKPKKEWQIHKRFRPERDQFVEAWDWLESRSYRPMEINESGFKAQIEEMARFGYIDLKYYQQYPSDEPNWEKLEAARENALIDLASVRSLVTSLPDHLSS